jgi:hypothetical protein
MLDKLQLTYTSYNGQNLNSPAVSVIRGSIVLVEDEGAEGGVKQRAEL